MEKDEIIQLLKSEDIEDRKLGVIMLSKICTRKEFKDIIDRNNSYSINGKLIITYHSKDWKIRVYFNEIGGMMNGINQNYSLQESLRDYGTDIERYELDI